MSTREKAPAPRKRSKAKATPPSPTAQEQQAAMAVEAESTLSADADASISALESPASEEGKNAGGGQLVAMEEIEPADEAVVERVEHLNRGVGYVLITAGVVGLVVPGVLGTPFLIMGALALWPGNRKRVENWRKGHSPKIFHGAMKQINRFLDDLEKRYPRTDKR